MKQEVDPDIKWDEYMRTSRFQTSTPKFSEISEYFRLVNAIFGTYLAIAVSLNEAAQNLEERQEEAVRNNEATMEHLDNQFLLISKIEPTKPRDVPEPENSLHMCSQGGFKKRNVFGGENHLMAANMCIVMMYTYWDDHYRQKIADAVGKGKKDVGIEVMRDLGILRNSIIHHGGYMKTDKTCRILTGFKPGEKINIDLEQFEKIKREIEKGLSEYSRELEIAIEKGHLTCKSKGDF